MTPLVLIPGMMCDARMWGRVPQALAPRPIHHALPVAGATIADMAAAVLADAPARFALAGLSMGGIVAMEMLHQAPARIERLALMDTNPLAEAAEMQACRAPQIARALAGDLEGVMRDEMKPNYLADPTDTATLDLCMDMARALGPEVFRRQSLALKGRADRTETLRRFTGPALVVMGEDDRACPRAPRPDARADAAIHAGHYPRRGPSAAAGTARADDYRPQDMVEPMTPDLLTLLRGIDTPTVCNAVEVAQGRRGFDAFTRGTMLCSDPRHSVVGYAVTAQIAAVAPPSELADVVRARRMAYYKAMHDAPKPSIAVIEDLDFPDCIGAYWGEVNTTIHKGFGMSGALTNGVMRDLGDLPDGFPVIAGSIGPSHGFVHVRTLGQPVIVFGLRVGQGDLVHADRHGAVVIPPEVIPALAGAIKRLLDTEKLVLDPARAPGFDFASFERAWAAFEKART